MNEVLSKKLNFFSFWLIVLVVLLHSAIGVDQLSFSVSIFDNLQKFISFGLCQIAVPFFFIISGYLFFFKIESQNGVLNNIIKRKKNITIPLYFMVFYLVCFYFNYSINSFF